MTTASPAACQRVNPRRQPPTLPSSYTATGDTTSRDRSEPLQHDYLGAHESVAGVVGGQFRAQIVEQTAAFEA